ncbi:hypothetical protein GCM10017673_22300 [Streptosporangium violaceochromogenes]|nr:hypothetical protein GCM10017673_22300 [Streptosporangium violaceochromogenes]
MPTLKQEVSRDDDPPIRSLQHRGVVPGTEKDGPSLWQASGNTSNNSEFAEISDCDDAPPVHHRVRWPSGTDPIAREDVMVQAYILIQTEVGKAANVAGQIAAISGVTQAEDVTGPYDVIVRAEARNVDDLGKLVVAQIQAVEGITRTLTCPIVHI